MSPSPGNGQAGTYFGPLGRMPHFSLLIPFLILTQNGKIMEVKLYHSLKDSYAGTYTHTYIHFYIDRCVVSCMNVATDCPWIGFI
jgi:hypothetical protein